MFVVWATAAAVVSMMVALWALPASSGLPLRRFPRRHSIAYVGSIGAVSVLLTTVVGLLADSAPVAVTVSLAATLTVLAASLRQLVPLRRVQRFSEQLQDAATRSAARAGLLDCVRRAQPEATRDGGHHAVVVLTAASALVDARLWQDALSLLDSLDPAALTPSLRANRAVGAATCMLYLGDREGARARLASIPPGSASATVGAAIEASQALLLALTGSPREALRQLDALELPEANELRLGRARDVARAHALQALGETVAARAALERLRGAHGPDGLLRVQALNGPASGLATALLKGWETPYRG